MTSANTAWSSIMLKKSHIKHLKWHKGKWKIVQLLVKSTIFYSFMHLKSFKNLCQNVGITWTLLNALNRIIICFQNRWQANIKQQYHLKTCWPLSVFRLPAGFWMSPAQKYTSQKPAPTQWPTRVPPLPPPPPTSMELQCSTPVRSWRNVWNHSKWRTPKDHGRTGWAEILRIFADVWMLTVFVP